MYRVLFTYFVLFGFYFRDRFFFYFSTIRWVVYVDSYCASLFEFSLRLALFISMSI